MVSVGLPVILVRIFGTIIPFIHIEYRPSVMMGGLPRRRPTILYAESITIGSVTASNQAAALLD
jgi:hypothetical protein